MSDSLPLLFEVCLQDVAGARAAQTAGAQRIELCAALTVGGITPSLGTIRACREAVDLPMMVMIRPRGGDFLYDEDEYAAMLRDVELCKTAGVDGVVFGLLQPDGRIDTARTQQLIERARPMEVTFHRAFDVCVDPLLALEQLIELGIDRVLTSGQAATAPAGRLLIRELIQRANGRIGILAGGGLTPDNLAEFLQFTGAREYHATAFRKTTSLMRHRNDQVYMGLPGLAEYERETTGKTEVAAFLAAAIK